MIETEHTKPSIATAAGHHAPRTAASSGAATASTLPHRLSPSSLTLLSEVAGDEAPVSFGGFDCADGDRVTREVKQNDQCKQARRTEDDSDKRRRPSSVRRHGGDEAACSRAHDEAEGRSGGDAAQSQSPGLAA